MSNKVKMCDVARLAGVSAAAVSRYVNGTGSLSAHKQRAIRQAIDELNYAPDETHPSRFPRWKVFGILLPPFAGAHYFSELGAQFEVNANRAGFHSLAFRPDFGHRPLLDILKEVTRERLAGVFVPSFPQMTLTQQELDFISASEIPILILSEFMKPYPTLNCIVLKSAEAVEQAVLHLAGAGCRRLAYLGPPAAINKASIQRGSGFLSGAQKAGLAYAGVFEVPIFPQIGPQMGHRAARAAFAERPDIDGLVCWSDEFAAGALWYLSQTGRRVPQDVKLVAFNDEYSPYLCPPVSALYMDTDEITRLAVEQLCRLQSPAQRMITKQVPVQPRLLVRASTTAGWPCEM